jgi:hypothetical protein
MIIYLANWIDCSPGVASLVTCLGAYSSHVKAQEAASTHTSSQARLGPLSEFQYAEICPVEVDTPPEPRVGYGTI